MLHNAPLRSKTLRSKTLHGKVSAWFKPACILHPDIQAEAQRIMEISQPLCYHFKMAILKDHNGREIRKQKIGDRVKYTSDNKYYVLVNKHVPLREVVMLMEKFYE